MYRENIAADLDDQTVDVGVRGRTVLQSVAILILPHSYVYAHQIQLTSCHNVVMNFYDVR